VCVEKCVCVCVCVCTRVSIVEPCVFESHERERRAGLDRPFSRHRLKLWR